MKFQRKKNSFDSIAYFYDFLSWVVFQDSIINSQKVFIDQIPEGSDVLIIGGGTGKILLEILLKRNVSKILYIDSSPRMIDLAKDRLSSLSNELRCKVEFRCGTELAIDFAESFDVICTFYLLDLFSQNEAHSLVRKLTGHTSLKSIWVFADFYKTQSFFHKVLYKAMLSFFRVIANVRVSDLNDYHTIFREEGWRETRSAEFYQRMIHAAVLMRV